MARSEQSKMEAETIIRWDETDDAAILWTASVAVRREWEAVGFPVVVKGGGWEARVAPRFHHLQSFPENGSKRLRI